MRFKSWKSGWHVTVGYDTSWAVFKTVSLLLGSVDYLVCRLLYPNFPAGASPWVEEDEGWGELYFPNTRAVWNEGR